MSTEEAQLSFSIATKYSHSLPFRRKLFTINFLHKGYICGRGNLRDIAEEIPESTELRKDAAS